MLSIPILSLSNFIGNYSIEILDKNGQYILTKKYGIKAFLPIAKNYSFSHYDDFGKSRSYGFQRTHLGNDLMGSIGTPIIAVESGTIAHLGWNQYGGWRIGIRSFDGKKYYYYAHLRKNHPYAENLKEGDIVIGMTKITNDTDVMTVTSKGLGKRTKGSEFPVKNRGGQGVKAHKVSERSGTVVSCLTVEEGDQIFVGTESGNIIRLNVDPLAKSGRDTTGNKLINLVGEDQVFTASLAPTTEHVEEEVIQD